MDRWPAFYDDAPHDLRPDRVERIVDPRHDAEVAAPAPQRPEQVGVFVATGPYVLAAWTPDKEFILKANPRYYGAKPAEATLRALVVGDDYLGDGKLFVQATAKTTATARAVQAARGLVRDYSRNREPV